MNRFFLLTFGLFFTASVCAQTTGLAGERASDFTISIDGSTVRFTPVMPPLMQKAGAKPAFYKYCWEFGDGSFRIISDSKNGIGTVTHTYDKPGDYTASLDATNYYDDGKKPTRKKKPVKVAAARNNAMASAQNMPDVFEPERRQAIAMKTSADPKPGEELTCIISYRNNGSVTTDGRLHLFFNEKKSRASHFGYVESRPCFGETENADYGFQPFETSNATWSANTNHVPSEISESGETSNFKLQTSNFYPPPIIIEQMLKEANDEFREEYSWRFSGMRAGERRNLFVTLAGTASMVRDTNTMIHIAGVFAPLDPALPPERVTLEIKIVASHDPNLIAVSDNRVNYRFLHSKKLDYKVQFQNNGEGPASTVKLTIRTPDGLNLAKMRPLDWYPKCPICPKEPTQRSCLDTASIADGLVFTFRNIYLPGSREAGISDFDSTQGYVRYRIEPERGMPKRSFRSQAQIVFDKNPPIRTNFSKTRFKMGLSPGLKVGYGFDPDAISDGYIFLGASLSPYKSWRVYPQVELLTGIRGRQDGGERVFRDTTITDLNADTKIIVVRDSLVRGSRGYLSLEVPFLLRKNFSRAFGLGIGGSARVFFDNGEDQSSTTKTSYRKVLGLPATQIDKPQTTTSNTLYNARRTQYTLFADVTLGAVRAGPNVGIRAGTLLGGSGGFQPFAQVSVELKL